MIRLVTYQGKSRWMFRVESSKLWCCYPIGETGAAWPLGQVDHWILCSPESQFFRSCALIVWENLQGIGQCQTQQKMTWDKRIKAFFHFLGVLKSEMVMLRDQLHCKALVVDKWFSMVRYQLLKECTFFTNHKTLKIGTLGQVDHLPFEAGWALILYTFTL